MEHDSVHNFDAIEFIFGMEVCFGGHSLPDPISVFGARAKTLEIFGKNMYKQGTN